ncbi:hypothetical protein ABIA33_004845 [Streptacidiphilus sp. MAP12-16]|uniref:hypothetical protein n=1 Tax=Streptacidiphilus sp. MAP12-16 TaxID=3156300 RepID=UPI00351906A0
MTPEISRRSALHAAALSIAAVVQGAETAHAAEDGSGIALGSALGGSAESAAAAPPDLAHYYLFREIVEGRRLVHRSGQWRFEGPPVPFDPAGVHPMVDDPNTELLPEGSPEQSASHRCDQAYTDVLTALHHVFDGHPDDFGNAVHLMLSLEKASRELIQMPYPAGGMTVLGPAFQLS